VAGAAAGHHHDAAAACPLCGRTDQAAERAGLIVVAALGAHALRDRQPALQRRVLRVGLRRRACVCDRLLRDSKLRDARAAEHDDGVGDAMFAQRMLCLRIVEQ
jgi:hypothetical protein